jgi:hypothetical protein
MAERSGTEEEGSEAMTPEEITSARFDRFMEALDKKFQTSPEKLKFVIEKVAIAKSKTSSWVISNMLTAEDTEDDDTALAKLVWWLVTNVESQTAGAKAPQLAEGADPSV